MVRDRAALFNLLIGLNGYTICNGVISEAFNEKNIVALPLLVENTMEVGYITHNKILPSSLCNHYIEALKGHVQQARPIPLNKIPLHYSA